MKTFRILKPFITIIPFCLTLMACKSHKTTVVNARAEFSSEQVWVLTEMKGKEVVYQDGQHKATIQINTEAGTFNGNNGCNRYFGIFADLGEGKMRLDKINATKMACPENFRKLERDFMQYLSKCDSYDLGEYRLILMQGDKELLTFEKEK